MFGQKPAVNPLGSAVRKQFVKCASCDCGSNKNSAGLFFFYLEKKYIVLYSFTLYLKTDSEDCIELWNNLC